MSNRALSLPQEVLKSQIVGVLAQSGRAGTSEEELRRKPALNVAPEMLRSALEELESVGEVVEWARRWYALRYSDWRTGRVQRLERGDALIRSGSGGEAGYFVRRRNLKDATTGDLVLLKAIRKKGTSRVHELPEMAVVKVLARRNEALVGTLERASSGVAHLLPFDPQVDFEIHVEGAHDVDTHQFVVVEMLSWPREGRGTGRARLVEVLGPLELPGVDSTVVLRHFDIPEDFSAAALSAAAGLAVEPSSWPSSERIDLRSHLIVTIDGPNARDFDDAISIERGINGGFHLGVHIADVSAFVEESGVLDSEALARGTSVYFPDRAVPMLPERLSADLCSLRPGVPRLTISALLDFDASGVLVQARFQQSVIESRRRMTYEEVRRLLEQPEDADRCEYGDILDTLETARQLMELLLARRLEAGSLDFDLPEGDVILDEEGFTVGVSPSQRTIAHRIIEEFMIAANCAVAAELYAHESPAVYRNHPPPEMEALGALRSVLHSLGIDLPGDLRQLHPSALQGVLSAAEGMACEPFIAELVLRAMSRAIYEASPSGHYALGARFYTHFTSPIRRYPDLVVHRRLKEAMGLSPADSAGRSILEAALPSVATHCSMTERRAEKAERTLLQWKLVRWLQGRIGEVFEGRITGVHRFGLFVQLKGLYVDGFIPAKTLPDDYYLHEAEEHRLVGQKSGRAFRLTDEVRVLLSAVDLRRRSLDLRLIL